jgi:GNAT superfamily N-acetyltransferase
MLNRLAHPFSIRNWERNDDIGQLTSLLHLAYSKLAKKGLRYLATHQDSTTTQKRIDSGVCVVAVVGNQYIGTVTYYSPKFTMGCEWYECDNVASYGQFGVHPDFQSSGIGSKLIAIVENLAVTDGADEIAIDTAETAFDLIKFYERRGYRIIENVQWKETNYRSVIMSKRLAH